MARARKHVRVADLGLLRRWIVARVRLNLRSSRGPFFTFVFPLVLLALLDATSGDSRVSVPGGKITLAQYFTPSIGVYALSVACYVTPIFSLAAARELGVLKRIRGTPLSPGVYLSAWLVATILAGLAAVGLMFVVAVPAFGVDIYPRLLPAAVVTALIGAASLASLGVMVSTFVRRADAAPAIANLTLFPLLFLSGVFFPLAGAPGWVVTLAHVFPLSHIVEAFTACFSPYTQGSGVAPRDLAVTAAWGTAAMVVAVRRFRWDTEEGSGRALWRKLPLGNSVSGRRS